MAPLGASRKFTGNGGYSGRGSECARRPVAAHLGDRGPDRRGGRGGGAPLSRDFPPRPPRATRSAGPQRAGRGLSWAARRTPAQRTVAPVRRPTCLLKHELPAARTRLPHSRCPRPPTEPGPGAPVQAGGALNGRTLKGAAS